MALSACASLKEPPATFELSAPPPATQRAAATRAQILIPEPTATKALDSQQIVIKPTPQTIETLAASQWSDRLPRLIQLRTLQAFQNTGRVGAVGVPGQGLAIDYQIVMELRRFEIALEPGANAVVEISVKALNDKTGVVRSTRIFRAVVPVASAGNPAYVAALDTAYGQVADEIVAWTLRLL
ncbi:ABC-type transport auxiliary lipoprotein family protein [Aureimonas sp. AU12]|uniref:ABC-type transport auxiliary lipoprotein family protein n=1 Tax=Aureimonas sp. AU12 TaxID=1638161 RepID=UPI001FCD74BD|nr:ABC-type transport auxiliary lipoprotein family protein [Aureimonas sp. AU12]